MLERGRVSWYGKRRKHICFALRNKSIREEVQFENLFSRQNCLQDYCCVQIESHVNRRHLYQCIVEIDRYREQIIEYFGELDTFLTLHLRSINLRCRIIGSSYSCRCVWKEVVHRRLAEYSSMHDRTMSCFSSACEDKFSCYQSVEEAKRAKQRNKQISKLLKQHQKEELKRLKILLLGKMSRKFWYPIHACILTNC